MITIKMNPKRSVKLARLFANLQSGPMEWLKEVSLAWKDQTQKNLSGSVTGRYPATRSGLLKSRVLPSGPQLARSGGTVYAKLGVHTRYAEIQEEGGRAGRNLAAVVPPRPYARPALITVLNRMYKVLRTMIMRGV